MNLCWWLNYVDLSYQGSTGISTLCRIDEKHMRTNKMYPNHFKEGGQKWIRSKIKEPYIKQIFSTLLILRKVDSMIYRAIHGPW